MTQISDYKIHLSVPPLLSAKDSVAIDTEIFSIPNGKFHRPVGQFGCATFCADGKNVYVVFNKDDLKSALKNVEAALHIYHNAKFDVMQMRRLVEYPDRRRLWDTFIVERILFSGYYDTFALKDLSRRYCGAYIEKDLQTNFAKRKADYTHPTNGMTEDEIDYAAIDAVITWRIYKQQRQQVSDEEIRIWADVELPVFWANLRRRGVLMDTQKWLSIVDKKSGIVDALYAEFKEQYGINVNSAKSQLQPVLEKILGVKLPNTNAKTLSLYKDNPVVARVLDYRKPKKAVSTYGESFLLDIENDGRIYTDFNQVGAKTGRYSSNSPNLQNIPVREGKEYRDCFIAAPGNTFIIGDWSSQEPRFLTHFANDEELRKIFKSKKDIYIAMGHDVLHIDFEKSDPLRNKIKAVFLGLGYGKTAFGLAQDLGISEDEADELRNAFFTKYPGIREYVEGSIKSARKNGFVSSFYGRKIWVNPYSNDDDKTAPNYPIQSSAGEAMKVAYAKIDTYWMNKYGYNPVILLIHDEMVLEVEEELKDEAVSLLNETMVSVAEAMHTGIPAVAEVYVGKSWAEKH